MNRSVVEERQARTAVGSKSEERGRLSVGGRPGKKRTGVVQLESIDHARQMAKLQGIIDKTEKALIEP